MQDDSGISRKEALKEMLKEIRSKTDPVCQDCRAIDCGNPLLFEPIEENPVVVLVSQAPGDRKGAPLSFEGLVNWLSRPHVFIRRLFDNTDRGFEVVKCDPNWKSSPAYWTHLGKCFPGPAKGGHKPPPKRCACFLWRELQVVKPRLVVGLGGAVWAFFRAYTEGLASKKFTDTIRDMVKNPENPILVRKPNEDRLQFELVPLPHPGRSGQAYWNRSKLREMQEKAIKLCQDKIRRAMSAR
jgi:uracil-DNA glycosylase